jgi:hypothetical protein
MGGLVVRLATTYQKHGLVPPIPIQTIYLRVPLKKFKNLHV